MTKLNLASPFFSTGYAGYKLCYYEVMKVIKGIVHQPYEVKGSSIFYAFSYYYDRAVESGLIGEWVQTEESPSSAIIFHANYHHLQKNRYLNYMFVCFLQMAAEVVRLKSGILRREPRKVRVTCYLL